MASEVTIPRLGWNMDEGTFVGWLKSDGERVAVGEPLFSLEGDKATQDIESLDSGILRIAPEGPKNGDKIAVGALIGYLVEAGEPAPFGLEQTSKVASNGTSAIENRVEPVMPAQSAATHEAERVEIKLRVTPRARRVARELGVDVRALEGSGSQGRIVERDVRAAEHAVTATIEPPNALPLHPIRRVIAERMANSARTAAAVTLTTTVDATNLVNLRTQFKAVADLAGGGTIAYMDIIVKLTALALERHPLLRGRLIDDAITVPSKIDIGIAVDADQGLFVPVLRDVPNLTLRQLASRSRELIDRARQGSLKAADMQGGVFTVTNLGAFGIEAFTPIINLPECAILGLGRIQKQVIVDEDQRFVARDRMTLSLTFDHRIVDGAPAARFLQTLGALIENPSPWLLP
jgi:pyruvate dehydrogenase E2 component (dihydrolipoamide acetyltransferase)